MTEENPLIIFGKYLLELRVSRQGAFQRKLRLALNEGECIVDELLGQAVELGIDPLHRNLFLKVCKGAERKQLIFAGILAVDIDALEADHLAGAAGNGLLDRFFTSAEGLVDIYLGGEMRAAALKQAKLNAANLDAGEVLFHDGSEQRGQPAELRVTEAVACGGLGLRDKAAVGIVDALGDGDEYLAVGLINLIDVG